MEVFNLYGDEWDGEWGRRASTAGRRVWAPASTAPGSGRRSMSSAGAEDLAVPLRVRQRRVAARRLGHPDGAHLGRRARAPRRRRRLLPRGAGRRPPGRQRSHTVARVLILSTKEEPSVVVYPDSESLRSGPGRPKTRLSSDATRRSTTGRVRREPRRCRVRRQRGRAAPQRARSSPGRVPQGRVLAERRRAGARSRRTRAAESTAPSNRSRRPRAGPGERRCPRGQWRDVAVPAVQPAVAERVLGLHHLVDLRRALVDDRCAALRK